jgi:hypothetical protein
MIVGHEKALSQIPEPLPSALLLLGPSGIGKKRVGGHLLNQNTQPANWQIVSSLTKETARAVIRFHESSPLVEGPKMSLIDLSRASDASQNVILKILEDPPHWSKFILHSDIEPLLTVKSRCFNVRFGVLSDSEVNEVLAAHGIAQHAREEAVRHAQGRVSLAMDYAYNTEARAAVEAVLRNLLNIDGPGLERSLSAALSQPQEKDQKAFWRHKEVVADLLARSIRTSLSDPHHALWKVHQQYRVQALKVLESKARPDLRVKSAVWTLAAGL